VPVGRVCFVAESQVGIGSIARTLKPLALRSENPTVEWVDVTYAREDGWLERLPFSERLVGTARGFLQTRHGLRKGPFDALLFLTHNPAVLHVGALKRTPALLWTDVTPAQLDEQAEWYGHPQERSGLVRSLKKRAVQRTFLAAHRCVAWSEWARRSLVRDYGVPEERTAVVPAGIDLERWKFPIRERVQPGLPIRLLFVGGDFRRKGGPLLLKVLQDRFPTEFELDVVTREPVPPQPHLRVHHGLTPGSEPLLALYQAADAFVLPTLADCSPVAAVEAMAAGLPVITTTVGANAEAVEDGQSGWLVPPGDASALAERLAAIAKDPAMLARMGDAAREVVRTRFDARQTLTDLLRLALEPAAPGDLHSR
jgi:glycosyltransferase involved in cell wall biosynthesis